jgi:RNA polymerase sigma-70 factor (ECF subfamily)
LSSDSSQPVPLSPDTVQDLYQQHSKALSNFLLGVLKDQAAAADVLQTTFTKLLQKGHLVQQDSIRSWLFKVAFNEALIAKRKAAVRRRHTESIAWKIDQSAGAEKGNDHRLSQSMHNAIRHEQIEQVQDALQQLPKALQEIVQKRIFEGLKFREIAEQLDTPLGTVLARMHSALKKLKSLLREANDEK